MWSQEGEEPQNKGRTVPIEPETRIFNVICLSMSICLSSPSDHLASLLESGASPSTYTLFYRSYQLASSFIISAPLSFRLHLLSIPLDFVHRTLHQYIFPASAPMTQWQINFMFSLTGYNFLPGNPDLAGGLH